MQYKLGGIAHRLIYWNVSLLVSLVFFTNLVQGHSISPIGLLCQQNLLVLIKAMDVRNVCFFHDGFGIYF
jgi:hypothetical protein